MGSRVRPCRLRYSLLRALVRAGAEPAGAAALSANSRL